MNPTAILARGPWEPEDIVVTWLGQEFEPGANASERADQALERLRQRGSPAFDGRSARLVSHEVADGKLKLVLQPVRWALRLLGDDAAEGLSAICLVRSADGRWLAGRRAMWLASWAGRWALGAAGSIDVGENPAATLVRELEEEWSVRPERLTVEALIDGQTGTMMLVGQAWLHDGSEVTPDSEHDEYAWWPAEPERWPAEGDAPLLALSALVSRPDDLSDDERLVA
jgi:8-oxo-dGTP diphosphatase